VGRDKRMEEQGEGLSEEVMLEGNAGVVHLFFLPHSRERAQRLLLLIFDEASKGNKRKDLRIRELPEPTPERCFAPSRIIRLWKVHYLLWGLLVTWRRFLRPNLWRFIFEPAPLEDRLGRVLPTTAIQISGTMWKEGMSTPHNKV
jgi:hypothetical protein